jgi:hypothetical protein|tara:strand:- start:676 stop:1128 length:453 start_codon:yes stop_codon:yes gene_type:complete
MYIKNLYNEIKIWVKIRKIAQDNKNKLLEKGFRVDWVGRIYTVINLPEEVVSAPISQEGYVLMQLREHDKLFLDLGIADYVSPEFNPIPNTDSFLLVLSADREYLKTWPIIVSTVKTTIGLLILRVIYILFESYGEKISELWNKITTLLF